MPLYKRYLAFPKVWLFIYIKICLMSLRPYTHKANWSKAIRQIIFCFRKVETVFSQLSKLLM
ncbi:MAG: hypothetical protein OSJ73_25325, partial [Lachnospiraceae bacterium]|nr:hypothetical protein [Lachnospiraceae bacterium]